MYFSLLPPSPASPRFKRLLLPRILRSDSWRVSSKINCVPIYSRNLESRKWINPINFVQPGGKQRVPTNHGTFPRPFSRGFCRELSYGPRPPRGLGLSGVYYRRASGGREGEGKGGKGRKPINSAPPRKVWVSRKPLRILFMIIIRLYMETCI